MTDRTRKGNAPRLAKFITEPRGTSSKDPFGTLFMRQVDGASTRAILDARLNPFTKNPYTEKYKRILTERKRLPAFAQMEQFYKIFNSNQIMVVIGATGTGKTTQSVRPAQFDILIRAFTNYIRLPQFVVYTDMPHTRGKIVACTQPRRIAATSVARRVAEEMDVQLGRQVGYSIRFEDMTQEGTTFLKYMTDGMLLREAMADRDLKRYSTIILDEVHERTLATDILMGLLKEIARRRDDLKIVIMSATLDALKFQKYFSTHAGSTVPLLKFPARIHPVDIFFTRAPEPDYVEAAIRAVLTIHRSEPEGDVLVFLTGEEEIEDACRKIRTEAEGLNTSRRGAPGPLLCLPLYSALPPAQQQRIFDPTPPGVRKVVVSTNIAETSLTIDGIVYVVDPGFSKQKSLGTNLAQILNQQNQGGIIACISNIEGERAAACWPCWADATRCYRLYPEKEYMELAEQTHPEILRSNLANTVLELAKLGVTNLLQFDYVDAPAPETIMRALELLNYLSGIDDNCELTPLGAIMAEFPLDPQLAKLLVVSPEFRCSNEILTIVAMLSAPNVWLRPLYRRREADAARAQFVVPDGDHLTLVKVYNSYLENKTDKDWCWNNYLSQRALQQAESVRQQLARMMEKLDLKIISQTHEHKLHVDIRRALVCGFFMQIAHRDDKGNYVTVKDQQIVSLHPSCDLAGRPEWVLFNEFVLTTQPYVRTVTVVQPEWLLDYGGKYYDLASFPNSDAKRALEQAATRNRDAKTGKKSKKLR
ncbi:DEAH-box ATP-dependent RNA helicase prp43 [Ceratobasidium sp. 414]|nr:DEAH-box ATP-dependent RNA helicase prp43 [Ceratobasidium sp. 414]